MTTQVLFFDVFSEKDPHLNAVEWYSDLILHIHTHKNTVHSEANRLTHPCKYILTAPAMSSQQLSVLHWMNNSLILKIYFPQSFLFKDYLLVEVIYMLIGCNKTKFFLWNTNNTDRNDVNKQNTHTNHSEKHNTGKG